MMVTVIGSMMSISPGMEVFLCDRPDGLLGPNEVDHKQGTAVNAK